MAITRLGGANAITGTLPAANINDTSIGNITALPAGVGGKVVQVVSSGVATPATINSTSYVLAISLAITPSSASNKIFIKLDGGYQQDDANGYSSQTKLTQTIGGTETEIFEQTTGTDITEGVAYNTPNFAYLDTTNTTSEVTYKVYGKTSNSSSDWRIREQTMLNAFEILG
jgi:hypothetical protein